MLDAQPHSVHNFYGVFVATETLTGIRQNLEPVSFPAKRSTLDALELGLGERMRCPLVFASHHHVPLLDHLRVRRAKSMALVCSLRVFGYR